MTPIANEDLERETLEKTSSVHFLRFELTREMIAALKAGTNLRFGIDHAAYRYEATLSDAVGAALVQDLTG